MIERSSKSLNILSCTLTTTGPHVIESLIKIDELNCIQVNLDREAVPDWNLDMVMRVKRYRS